MPARKPLHQAGRKKTTKDRKGPWSTILKLYETAMESFWIVCYEKAGIVAEIDWVNLNQGHHG